MVTIFYSKIAITRRTRHLQSWFLVDFFFLSGILGVYDGPGPIWAIFKNRIFVFTSYSLRTIKVKMSNKYQKHHSVFRTFTPKNWTSGDVKHTNRFVSTKSIILDSFQTTKSLKTIIFEGFTQILLLCFNDFFKKCQKSSRIQFLICKKIHWFRIWYQILLKLLIWWVVDDFSFL